MEIIGWAVAQQRPQSFHDEYDDDGFFHDDAEKVSLFTRLLHY
jgi:hypothetical protein